MVNQGHTSAKKESNGRHRGNSRSGNSLYSQLRIYYTANGCVAHWPPGTAQWKRLEHRLFSLIGENWAGEPLVSYAVLLQFIRPTKSDTGFRCRATLDQKT